MLGGQPGWRLGDGIEADDDHSIDRQAECGPQRRVQTHAAIDVPASCLRRARNMDGREEARDRRRSAYVLAIKAGRDVIDALADVLTWHRMPFDKDHAAGRRRGGPHNRSGIEEPRIDVAMQPLEVDHPGHGPSQRPGVEQPREHCPRHAQGVGRVAKRAEHGRRCQQRPQDLIPTQCAPQRYAPRDYLIGAEVSVGGQVGDIHRSDARANKDGRALATRLKCRQQHRQRPDLVRPACATPGQYKSNPLLGHNRPHAPRSPGCGRTSRWRQP